MTRRSFRIAAAFALGSPLPLAAQPGQFDRCEGAAVEAFAMTALPNYEVVRDLRFDRIRP